MMSNMTQPCLDQRDQFRIHAGVFVRFRNATTPKVLDRLLSGSHTSGHLVGRGMAESASLRLSDTRHACANPSVTPCDPARLENSFRRTPVSPSNQFAQTPKLCDLPEWLHQTAWSAPSCGFLAIESAVSVGQELLGFAEWESHRREVVRVSEAVVSQLCQDSEQGTKRVLGS